MNKRDYKEFARDNYYHVYNRGNGKELIFLDSEDFLFFLNRLKENLFPETTSRELPNNLSITPIPRRSLLPENSFDLVSYCLMPNHYHLLLKQKSDTSISKLILKITTGYSMYFNKKYERVGHVFQDRFKAVHIDSNEYLLWLSAYIHQNPKTAKMIKNIGDYPWSSIHEYSGNKQQNLICRPKIILDQFQNSRDYFSFLEDAATIMKEKETFSDLFLD